MKGIEFIAKTFHKSLKEIGNELGISRKTVSDWVVGKRSVPKKHLPLLSKLFYLDESYFDKQLTDADRIRIQMVKIHLDLKKMLGDVEPIDDSLGKPTSIELKSLYEKLDKVPFIDMSRENVSLFRMIIVELLELRDSTKRNNGSMKILE